MWARLDVRKPVRNLAQHSRRAVMRAGWRQGRCGERAGARPQSFVRIRGREGSKETSEFSLYILGA